MTEADGTPFEGPDRLQQNNGYGDTYLTAPQRGNKGPVNLHFLLRCVHLLLLFRPWQAARTSTSCELREVNGVAGCRPAGLEGSILFTAGCFSWI